MTQVYNRNEFLGGFYMSQSVYRKVVVIPEGGHQFLTANLPTKDSRFRVDLRVAGGRSFISGYKDEVLFDGVIQIEPKISFLGDSTISEKEAKTELYDILRQLFKQQCLNWHDKLGVYEIGLFNDSRSDVETTSELRLWEIARNFRIPIEELAAQAQWKLVEY